jgi:hypothetical protein
MCAILERCQSDTKSDQFAVSCFESEEYHIHRIFSIVQQDFLGVVMQVAEGNLIPDAFQLLLASLLLNVCADVSSSSANSADVSDTFFFNIF